MTTLTRVASIALALTLVLRFGGPARADDRPSEDALLLDIQPLLQQYAPHIDRVTLTSMIAVESSGWPWTVKDDTTGESFYLPSYDDAVRLANRLLAVTHPHNLDLGPAQINTSNRDWLHLTVEDLLVPRLNIIAARTIIAAARKTEVHSEGEAWYAAHGSVAVDLIRSAAAQLAAEHGSQWVQQHPLSARDAVVTQAGEDWVSRHPADAARHILSIYHANSTTADPDYIAHIVGIAPHVEALLSSMDRVATPSAPSLSQAAPLPFAPGASTAGGHP